MNGGAVGGSSTAEPPMDSDDDYDGIIVRSILRSIACLGDVGGGTAQDGGQHPHNQTRQPLHSSTSIFPSFVQKLDTVTPQR